MSTSLLPLIKQGDPAAIATLINRSLQAHGAVVQVQRRQDCLHVLLESGILPAQPVAIAFVYDSLRLLGIESIQTVTVYGRQIGDRLPSWQRTISLKTHHMSNDMSDDRSRPTAEFMEKPDRLENMTDAPLTAPESGSESGSESGTLQTPPNILQRPEAIVLLIFCSIILFWETYQSLMEEIEPVRLSSSQLAHRLNTSRRAVRTMQRQDNFSLWTSRLDPDGIAWVYRRGLYRPAEIEQ